ncbi:MAG: hypothetical protein A3G87_08305 [Omnitrophica bacterium RIFCSPLOWO2_12_FULL_50_11]|nr:MAG: hypothetical protein A3G87_08305 [Omnitrophica bacterium RIFCSPLOWO2_12_FULL_50_11]
MVIEDDQDTCTLVRSRLMSVGFDVLTAHDGETGLHHARSRKPDLIVLDLMLPKLPGEEVCKAIREDEDVEIANIPIVMFTAKDALVDRVVGKIIGATSYVVKPSSGSKLVQEIIQALPPEDEL